MRKLVTAAMAAGLLVVAAPAFAAPPDTVDSETNNEVNCGAPGTVANPNTSLQVNTAGDQNGGALVICNDGTPAGAVPAPIQGRVIVSGTQSGANSSGYIAADGDRSNPTEAEGWIRVDFSKGGATVKCGPEAPADASTPRDSQTQPGNQANCG